MRPCTTEKNQKQSRCKPLQKVYAVHFRVDGFLFCECSDSGEERNDFTSTLIFCGMISSSLIFCGQLHSRANCIQWELKNKKSDARMYLQ